MKSKYTYFVTYEAKDSLCIKTGNASIDVNNKIKSLSDIQDIEKRISTKISNSGLDSFIITNYILMSETHESERSDDKKEFLKELHELFTKYNATIERCDSDRDTSLWIGEQEVMCIDSSVLNNYDIERAILELK